MSRLAPDEVVSLFLALALLLGTARALGELARRWRQPAVLGEILAGVLLGPTVFGRLAPDLAARVLPREGGAAVVLDGIATLAVALFLLVAGMEVDLQRVRRQSRVALTVSLAGIAVPFALGFTIAWLAPGLLGGGASISPTLSALFFATALSISSLPVIARTLMDLQLFRTDLGMTIIAAAIVQDIVGWIVFAVILGLIGSHHGLPIAAVVAMTLGFAVFALTALRWFVHRALRWVQAHASAPGGVLGLALSLSLLGAAATEWIGVHAIFGTFLVGVAIGDSTHLREQTRGTLDQFISFIFAPLFFASVGLKVDFVRELDPFLVVLVLVVASAGKLLGCGLGARLAGTPANEAWAIGFGMNARGAMEIILGLLALQHGVIGERLFVALVIMALVTSMLGGPLMQRALRQPRPQRFRDYIAPRAFVRRLEADARDDVLRELARALAPATPLATEVIAAAVIEREELMPTGLGRGLAVPNARLPGLTRPVIAVGVSALGVDFDAADGQPAQIIIMILVPEDDHGAQWAILADIARAFASDELRERVLEASSFTGLLAALNVGERQAGPTGGPRRGVLLVGARATARAIAKKLISLEQPVWLVDRNPESCAAAAREGLVVVHGDALRDVVLFQAHAADAAAVLALTPNVEVNALAAAFARAEFHLPVACAFTGPGVRDVHPAFLGPVDIDLWDGRVAQGQAEWVQAPITPEAPTLLAAVTRAAGDSPALPVVLARDGVVHLLHAGLEAQPGDVVHALVHRHAAAERSLERLLLDAPLLELDARASLEDLLPLAARELAPRLGLAPDVVLERLSAAARTTALGLLAVTRATVPGTGQLALLLARGRPGVVLPAQSPHVVGVLVVVASDDRRAELLRVVSALAQLVVATDDVERAWLAAPTGAELREVLVHAAAAVEG
jgi:Kef-type K+ transport system membrane component KefB/mannitol/fructose-specific phosphotransferase system IIA component (Ntr-type)